MGVNLDPSKVFGYLFKGDFDFIIGGGKKGMDKAYTYHLITLFVVKKMLKCQKNSKLTTNCCASKTRLNYQQLLNFLNQFRRFNSKYMKL